MGKVQMCFVDTSKGVSNYALGYNREMCKLRYWFICETQNNGYNEKTEVTAALHAQDLYLGKDYLLFNCDEGSYARSEFCIATNNLDIKDKILSSALIQFGDINS